MLAFCEGNGDFAFSNCLTKMANSPSISCAGEFNWDTEDWDIDPDKDISTYQGNIEMSEIGGDATTLQVGINGDSSSQIIFDTSLEYNLSPLLSDITSNEAYNTVQEFLSTLSAKATELGAVSNRLESALDSIGVNIENLTSSRSTIKDADIAQVSSDYIRHQILQQAAATLLATANQSPAIALQLI